MAYFFNNLRLNKDNLNNQLWLAYSYFHNGDFPKALQIYTDLTKRPNYDLSIHTFKACCLYALCKFKEGLEEAKKGPSTELNVNYLFNIIDKSEVSFSI